MDLDSTTELQALVAQQPIGALGTLHTGAAGDEPFVSMVPVAWLPFPMPQPVIHVSGLAPHTRDLVACARVSLMLTAPLTVDTNPQALARLTVQADARVLARTGADWARAQTVYLTRFPRAEQTFALGDFRLVLLQPRSARFVAGFGRAHGLTAAGLTRALTTPPA